VVAHELLGEAEKVVSPNIHPMTIIAERFQSDLCKIAMTTLSLNISAQDKEHFANLAVDAVPWLKVL
jgi:T-complex protein 1 subunit beta